MQELRLIERVRAGDYRMEMVLQDHHKCILSQRWIARKNMIASVFLLHINLPANNIFHKKIKSTHLSP